MLSLKNETHEHYNTNSEVDKKELYEPDELNYLKILWRNRAFESQLIKIYDMKSWNSLNSIHDNVVNVI